MRSHSPVLHRTERMITSLSLMMPTNNHCDPNRSLAFSLLRIEYEYSTGGMFVCITRSLVDSNRRTSYTLFTDCFRLIFILYQLVSHRFFLHQNQIKIISDLIIRKRRICSVNTNIVKQLHLKLVYQRDKDLVTRIYA